MIESVIERGIEAGAGLHVVLNAPEFFQDPSFLNYLEKRRIFTWHRQGDKPGEYSDVIVLVEPCLSGDGDSSDLPAHIWETIMRCLRLRYGPEGDGVHPQMRNRSIAVRLTNLNY